MRLKFSQRILSKILRIFIRPFLNDEFFLRALYWIQMGKALDLKHPITMNEKLQWLKLNNRNQEMTSIVDKLKVKSIISEIIGEEYIIKTIKVWDNPEDISLNELPEQFVLKTNHSGGNTGVFICKDRNTLDLKSIQRKIKKSLKENIYYNYAEWPYRDVEKKIFAEEYLGDNIVDYKFYCFNGYVDCVLLCIERETNYPKFYFFDRDWRLLRYNKRGLEAPKNFSLPKPENMDEMFDIAAQLSSGYPFVRVDLYNINGKIFFGEMTFYPASGLDSNRLAHTDEYFGNLIDLSMVRN